MRSNARHYRKALRIARQIDQGAVSAFGAPDCLLVDVDHAKEVLAAIPGSWEDPNPEGSTWTRIVVSAAGEDRNR